MLKSRDTTEEIDQGYGSARTSPNLTPCTSPTYQVSPASSCSSSRVDPSYRQIPVETRPDTNFNVLDLSESAEPAVTQNYYLPTVDVTLQRVDSAADYRYCRSRRLIDASLESVPSTSMGVKRGLQESGELERKRYRLASQMSQVVLWLYLVVNEVYICGYDLGRWYTETIIYFWIRNLYRVSGQKPAILVHQYLSKSRGSLVEEHLASQAKKYEFDPRFRSKSSLICNFFYS